MIAQPYWITSQLAIVPRPRGNDWLQDELSALKEAGIDVVVSMLEEKEANELGLREEGSEAEIANLVFINFPVLDRSVPQNPKTFVEFLLRLESLITTGRRIGVHCRACIGRSSIVTASLLIRSGFSPVEAWLRISEARGFPVPDTEEQRLWVNQHIKAISL